MKKYSECKDLEELLKSIQEDYDELELKKLNIQKGKPDYISNTMVNIINHTQKYLIYKFELDLNERKTFYESSRRRFN